MRRLALLAPLALLALATSSPAATRTYSSHQLHVPIPDVGTIVRTIDVPDSGPVSFVAVGVRIVHPRDSDLTLTLISPRGTRVLLSTREGGAGADYGSGPRGCSGDLAWFESDALDPISMLKPPFAGEQRPEQPLTALTGEQARGRWSLRVDDRAAGATGRLLCWQLELSRNVVSHVRVSRDGVSADLSYIEHRSYDGRVRIAVRRHGVVALTAPLSRFRCRGCPSPPYDTGFGNPLHVVDLDGDGEPEVLVDFYTGGAHCCSGTVFLRFDGRTYRGQMHMWGDVAYHLVHLRSDRIPDLLSGDDRFAYQFTYFAASVFPVQIWHYDRGALLDVTSSYRYAVSADASRIWGEYLRNRTERGADVRGLLAAWLADEYRLGRQGEAWKRIEAAYRRRELSAPRVDPLWPAGRKYLTALRAFLIKTGYAR